MTPPEFRKSDTKQESSGKLTCLFLARYAPNRTRTDPYTGLPWYLSEITNLIGIWGKPESIPVSFGSKCQQVVQIKSNWQGWLGASRHIRQLNRKIPHRPSAVFCGIDEFSLSLGLIAGRFHRAPVFCMVEDPPFTSRYQVHDRWSRTMERTGRLWLVKRMLKNCQRIFCFIEKEVLNEFVENKSSICQMMNGASPQALEWHQTRSRIVRQPQELIVGFVGALNRMQGIDTLLDIFAHARRRLDGLRLRLIGPLDPAFASEFRALLQNLGLEQAVEVTGWLPYQSMLEKLDECFAGVYCNVPTEWFLCAHPLKVCEYLALKKPTVAWDYPGVRRLLDNGRLGILVSHGDKTRFADWLVRLSDLESRKPIEENIRAELSLRWTSDFWYQQVIGTVISYQKEITK